VSNGLFIRSYPVAAVQVIPTSYSAGPNGYFLLCLIPVAAISFFVVALNNGYKHQWVFEGLAASVFFLLLAVGFLQKLKLDVRIDGISFTTIFLGTTFVAFSEISTVVFIDHRHVRSEYQPRRVPRSWTAVITPNVETGKRIVRIPLSFFPQSAYEHLRKLLHPEVWESGT
jgi:hypothetical protein